MGKVILLSAIVIVMPAILLACVLFYLSKRRYESRMLRKDPRILAKHGRLSRDAAERLIDMRNELKGGAAAMSEVMNVLDALLQNEFLSLLPQSSINDVEKAVMRVRNQLTRINNIVDE